MNGIDKIAFLEACSLEANVQNAVNWTVYIWRELFQKSNDCRNNRCRLIIL